MKSGAVILFNVVQNALQKISEKISGSGSPDIRMNIKELEGMLQKDKEELQVASLRFTILPCHATFFKQQYCWLLIIVVAQASLSSTLEGLVWIFDHGSLLWHRWKPIKAELMVWSGFWYSFLIKFSDWSLSYWNWVGHFWKISSLFQPQSTFFKHYLGSCWF